MQLGGITRSGILAAMDERKRVGGDSFPASSGSRPETEHVVLHDGLRFDPESLLSAAHQHDIGEALNLSEFSVGAQQTAAFFRQHGFIVLTTPQDFVRRVGEVRPARRRLAQPLHRPLLLLYAIAQAVAKAPRLQPWSHIRDGLAPLLTKYAEVSDGVDGARYPFWALQSDGLWTVSHIDELEMTSGSRRPTLALLNSVNPEGGLLEHDYQIVRSKPEITAEAAAGLLLRYFPNTTSGLIKDLDLEEFLEGRWANALLPLPGVQLKNRDTIWHNYGGQKMGGIGYLGDGIVSAFADDKGPYADGRMPDTGWIAYVGDGLVGDQKLTAGNLLMQECQADQKPLRYWHKPFEMQFSFETWAVIVQRRMRWGRGDDGAWRREFVWILAPVSSPDRSAWPADVIEALDADDGELHDETGDYKPSDIDPSVIQTKTESDEDAYRRLNNAAEKQSKHRASVTKPSKVDRYIRSQSARAAVVRRSGGNCESPECAGHPKELTAAGAPILEVDHVQELAKGGPDVPRNMIALCPNCHALKTHGVNRERLRRVLRQTAEKLHETTINTGTISS